LFITAAKHIVTAAVVGTVALVVLALSFVVIGVIVKKLKIRLERCYDQKTSSASVEPNSADEHVSNWYEDDSRDAADALNQSEHDNECHGQESVSEADVELKVIDSQ